MILIIEERIEEKSVNKKWKTKKWIYPVGWFVTSKLVLYERCQLACGINTSHLFVVKRLNCWRLVCLLHQGWCWFLSSCLVWIKVTRGINDFIVCNVCLWKEIVIYLFFVFLSDIHLINRKSCDEHHNTWIYPGHNRNSYQS